MFYLIGIGNKIGDINLETLEAVEKCEKIYLEYYTSFYQNTLEEIKEKLRKEVEKAPREFVEGEIDKVIEDSSEQNNALLVIGDPLSATTHSDIVERCIEKNVPYHIINNISIFTLIGKTGLQIYKFGKTTSIPFYSEKFMPRTPATTLEENTSIGAHSLFLLDIDPINDNYLKVNEALKFLLKTSEKSLLKEETEVIACEKLGTSKEKMYYGPVNELIKIDESSALKPPVCIVIPGSLHFMEEENLESHRIHK